MSERLRNTPIEIRRVALQRASDNAPFLARLIESHTDDVARFLADGADAALAHIHAPRFDDADIMAAIRIWRGKIALLVALGDLSGEHDLFRTTRLLTEFADEAVDLALAAAIAERVPGAEPQGLAVIALGKMGSFELNYSSDIDPILIYDPQTMPRRSRDDPAESAVRIARRMVEILSARTVDDYVLRVDLRLRPSPEATPIVLPVEAAISYYESQALPWEQAAFIRSRAAAGDKALGQYFLSAIQPFIWRRSLDFRQLREIGAVSERIRDHYAQGQVFGPGYDIKRGRGGIRECEFFAQVNQLIYGGRDAGLRAPATVDALAALAGAGHIGVSTAEDLTESYRLYRRIEHRLQMIEDEQTHELPGKTERLDRVARLDGFADGAAVMAELAPHVARTGATYDGLVAQANKDERVPHQEAALAQHIAEAGFADPAVVMARVADWRGGNIRVLRSPAARTALEAVLPSLLAAFGRAPDPHEALNSFDRTISGLPSAINFFHLLAARPALLAQLARILTHAPTLAGALAIRSDLIEGLIDTRVFDCIADFETLAADMARGIKGRDTEQALDFVRAEVGERRFALGVQLIEQLADPLAVAKGYSDLAEAALVTLTDATVANFVAAHGRVPDSELVILALGRFGGSALTHASDLDLIFLFSGDFHAESDGRRPLGATQYYNRLAQRVITALSVPTAAGPLYEIDTRLRPSGEQGPLVVSLDSFARYQQESAWTWEHMALTRARIVYGSAEARAALDAMIADVLHTPRDHDRLLAEASKMRRDMAQHKPPAGPFDVKLIDGGLVDAEFATHVTQLDQCRFFDANLGIALHAMQQAGAVSEEIVAAEQLLTRMLVTLRLISSGADGPAQQSRALLAKACGAEDWDDLLQRYDAARRVITTWWGTMSVPADSDTEG